jgi:HD superfamily phosphohydrolase
MNKIIRDIVYNYIEFTDEVRSVIDTPSFQRLKFVKQTTLQNLYPSANHTRFEHSLGVMELAIQTFEHIEVDLKKRIKKEYDRKLELIPIDDYEINEITFYKNHLLYASLLHDVGHAPLSHVGELFFKKDKILGALQKFDIDISIFNEHVSLHEIMSCYIIIMNFKKVLKPCFPYLHGDIPFNFEFLFRIICGIKYDNNNIRNIIISIVNSPFIDVDRIDYLLRDNIMVGYIAPLIDYKRLLRSTILMEDRIGFNQAGISVIQQFIETFDSLYLWVYNHHIVIYTDFLYQTLFEHLDKVKDNKEYYESKIDCDFFSCDSISNKYINDSNINTCINTLAIAIVKGEKVYNYTKRIIDQIFSRNYLKPLWKTLHEYNIFINNIIKKRKRTSEKTAKKEIIEYISDDQNRREMVKELCTKFSISNGNIFIIARRNRYYTNKNFEIMFHDNKINLGSILPSRNFGDIYDDIAFYIFCRDANGLKIKIQEEVTNMIIDILDNNVKNTGKIMKRKNKGLLFDEDLENS